MIDLQEVVTKRLRLARNPAKCAFYWAFCVVKPHGVSSNLLPTANLLPTREGSKEV